ncbi:MAG: hypothetical protein JSV52_11840 [Candidatus Zixiibacteriota bacterium]|nr:MAG: hypothetical protein JSV52_11840 [candidate division Zixibacteria bacterium]
MHQLQMILNSELGERPARAPASPSSRPVRKISEARRAYLRRYYEANREKAREYQRRYNLVHKKKVRMASKLDGASRLREAVRETFNASDIMQAPTEKSVQILNLILKGERYFTM